ncbi:iron-containing alcohol dehydrogenase [bacterium]|nr:iron-containing alcohol dehydrogenase [bacterium]
MQLADLCPEPLPKDLNLPQEVVISAGAVTSLPQLIRRYLGNKVLWVADPDTWAAYQKSAHDVSAMLPTPHIRILPPNPHADTSAVEELKSAADGMTGLIAVGSGTINDIVKTAASQRDLPYVAIATAASMNGYASGIAAILDNGLKTTVPARPPRAIVLDTDILRSAPPKLTQAGLGDLISVNVSIPDWWLSNQLEGTGFDRFPGRLMRRVLEQVERTVAGLKRGDQHAFEVLARGLVLGGIAMVVAATSSPASGGEHLVSHLWDMEAMATGRDLKPHGAQVGVATVISSALYQQLLELDQPMNVVPPSWAAEEKRIRTDHGTLADVVFEPARKKNERASARIAALQERWPEIREGLRTFGIYTSSKVRTLLSEAGASHSLAALGVTRAEAARTLRIARDIRDRVTVLDLAFELGFFPAGIEKVLECASV